MPRYKHEHWEWEGDLFVRGFTDPDEASAYLAKQDPPIEAPADKCIRRGQGPEAGKPLIDWMRAVPTRHPWEVSQYCPEAPCEHTVHWVPARDGSRGAYPVLTWPWHAWSYKKPDDWEEVPGDAQLQA